MDRSEGPRTVSEPPRSFSPRLFLAGAALGAFLGAYLGFFWRILSFQSSLVGPPPPTRSFLAVPLATGLFAVALSWFDVIGTDVRVYEDRVEKRRNRLRGGTVTVPLESVALAVRSGRPGARARGETIRVLRADGDPVVLPNLSDAPAVARSLDRRTPPPADREVGPPDSAVAAVAAALGDRVVVTERELAALLDAEGDRVDAAVLADLDADAVRSPGAEESGAGGESGTEGGSGGPGADRAGSGDGSGDGGERTASDGPARPPGEG